MLPYVKAPRLALERVLPLVVRKRRVKQLQSKSITRLLFMFEPLLERRLRQFAAARRIVQTRWSADAFFVGAPSCPLG